MHPGITRPRRPSRTRLGAALAGPALLALMLSAAATPALAAAGDSYVVVTQADNGKAIDIPNDGTLAVVLQVNGGTGYEWRITEVPSPAIIGAPVHGMGPYYASATMPGAPVSEVFYLAAMAPGATTFAAGLYPPAGDTPTETFSIAILVRDESGAAASLTWDQCGDIVLIDSDGTVGITLDSNATTGYSWSVVTPPDATLKPEDDNGHYVAPAAGAPLGAGGSQHFGWTATGAGETRIELAYTQAGSQAAGRTCALTVVAGAPVQPPDALTTPPTETAATPPPTSTDGSGDTLPMPPSGLLLLLVAALAGTASVPVMVAVQRHRDR